MDTEYGLDTSRWQGQITQADVDAAAADNKKFWYFKGSGGDDGLYVDSQFQNTLTLLRNNGWHKGVYHFSGLGSNPQEEADYAVDNVWGQLITGEVAILDIDTFGVNDAVWAQAFLDVATERLGFKPVLYMNQDTENNDDWSQIVAEDYGLIVANYSVPPSGDVALRHWPFYLGQQYSSTGSVGNMSPLDLDAIFVDDISAWDRYGKPAPAPEAPPTPGTPEAAITNANPDQSSPLTPVPDAPPGPIAPPSPEAPTQTPPSETSSSEASDHPSGSSTPQTQPTKSLLTVLKSLLHWLSNIFIGRAE